MPQQTHVDLKFEFLFSMHAEAGTGLDLGRRKIVGITGGTFAGPNMSGKLREGGGDWARVQPDGSFAIDARATLETDDGELIYVYYPGVLVPKPDRTFYWRVTPRFETASEKYSWINNVIAVGVGTGTPKNVTYDIFKLV